MCESERKITLFTVGRPMVFDTSENKRYIVNKEMIQPIARTYLLNEKPKTNEPLKRRKIKYKI